jgi:K+-transporting ATPase ATPase C chain
MRTSIRMLLFFSLLCGVVYPLCVTAGAALFAPDAAIGSPIRVDGRVVGSQWIGQQFVHPGHLWGRPSATKTPYAPCQPDFSGGSGGSNLGPLHPELRVTVEQRVADLRAAAAAFGVPDDRAVPVDLVTASASGLDPHVSQAAAEYQVARVAAVRGVAPADVRSVFATATVARRFGVLGEPVVHVLRANLALDTAFGRLQR